MNIQEQLNSLIRGNPLSVDTYLREVCKMNILAIQKPVCTFIC